MNIIRWDYVEVSVVLTDIQVCHEKLTCTTTRKVVHTSPKSAVNQIPNQSNSSTSLSSTSGIYIDFFGRQDVASCDEPYRVGQYIEMIVVLMDIRVYRENRKKTQTENTEKTQTEVLHNTTKYYTILFHTTKHHTLRLCTTKYYTAHHVGAGNRAQDLLLPRLTPYPRGKFSGTTVLERLW